MVTNLNTLYIHILFWFTLSFEMLQQDIVFLDDMSGRVERYIITQPTHYPFVTRPRTYPALFTQTFNWSDR